MNAEEAAIVAKIIADPADDTHRLVYADWLCDRGEPGDWERGEFIRIQCDPNYKCDWAEGAPRERESAHGYKKTVEQTAHRYAFMPPAELVGWDTNEWVCYTFHWPQVVRVDVQFVRGFAETIACHWDEWKNRNEAMRARHPIKRVVFTSWPDVDMSVVATAEDFAFMDRGMAAMLIQNKVESMWPGIEFDLSLLR